MPDPVAPAADVIVIKLRLSPDKDLVKVEWRDSLDRDWGCYLIDKALLEGRSQEVRLQLGADGGLVESVMDERAGRQKCGVALARLAQAGARLHEALFAPSEPGPDAEYVMNRLRGLQKGQARIHVEVLSGVHVPWGLVNDGSGQFDEVPEKCNVEDYPGFWAVKFGITAIHQRVRVYPDMKAESIEPAEFRVLPLFHKDVLKRARDQLARLEEKDALDLLFPGAVYNWSGLESRWKEMDSRHGMLYVLCHASPTQLSVDPRERIERFQLTALKRRDTNDRRSACLVFLNACSTAEGAPHGGFLEATARFGFFGFIGTEASVPDVFALRFGMAFLRELLYHDPPLPVYQIMADLRLRHWPLSLLYSANCYPYLRVLARPDPSKLACWDQDKTNFSDPPVGTKDPSPW
jgi:hypothetical protein